MAFGCATRFFRAVDGNSHNEPDEYNSENAGKKKKEKKEKGVGDCCHVTLRA